MITLTGQAKSTNHIYKARCFGKVPSVYLSQEGKAIKEDYQKQLKKQYKGELLKDDVRLSVVFFHGDKRKRDIDGHNKLLLDSMNGIVYEDDSQIKELYLRKEYDKDFPRVTIEIIN